ncbi:unnamed protein product [Clonostachys rosea f. rosea IK726]|uniref:Zn(2)-C6 fungal-type domain-containing protein n=2 Tax=Bionectria ochroleuca TaxID=29856 RepID=A0A0B7KK99_BIOOC|nr:unnamed protein product [Clonostachys rosea f. rosea IK726]
MVGVPGKSKGCETCRHRRVKCDLQRPACGRCLRTNRTCPGYERGLIFVNNAPRETKGGQAVFRPKQYVRENVLVSRVRAKTSSSSPLRLLPPGLATSASEQHLIGSFWSSYLPNGRLATDEVIKFSMYGWTTVVDELYHKTPMVRLALCACALGLRGLGEKDPRLLQKSYQMYGKTLSSLQRCIREPESQQRHVVLTTLKLCFLYEIWLGAKDEGTPQFASWVAHVNGNTAFILSCDPGMFLHGHAHRMFADCRFESVVIATLTRQPTALSTSRWKEIPWKCLPKTPRDRLVDIMLDFPEITTEVSRLDLTTKEFDQLFQREKLIEKCWSIIRDLRRWEDTWGAEAVEFATNRVNTESSPEPPHFPSEDLAKGHIMLIYWAHCIMICDIFQSQIRKSLKPRTPAAWPEYTKPATYCRKLANLLRFFQINKSGSFFMNMVLTTTAYCFQYLSREEEDGPPIEKAMLLKALRGHIDKDAAIFANSSRAFLNSGANQPYLKDLIK